MIPELADHLLIRYADEHEPSMRSYLPFAALALFPLSAAAAAVNSTLPEDASLENSAFLCHWACTLKSGVNSTLCPSTAVTGAADIDCLCKDPAAQTAFVACLDRDCPAMKDDLVAFNGVLCDSGEKNTSDAVTCVFETCSSQLKEPIAQACGADADTKGECACTSQPVGVSLDQCLARSCPAIADTAREVYKMYCPLGGTEFTIGGSGEANVSTTIGPRPTETGLPSQSAPPDNAAHPLVRGGLAAIALFVAAIVAISL